MKRARLVKQKELEERMAQSPAHQPTDCTTDGTAGQQRSAVSMTVETVIEWLKERRSADRNNPREQFAALFTNSV